MLHLRNQLWRHEFEAQIPTIWYEAIIKAFLISFNGSWVDNVGRVVSQSIPNSDNTIKENKYWVSFSFKAFPKYFEAVVSSDVRTVHCEIGVCVWVDLNTTFR